ncbi:GGDEF domain-containing protein [Pseudomonas sp.]|uniref:GGDEF domain-containing protein n=1 Tax=Pseudomonas sp. TaxID=306 RepID=UPI0031DFD531
MKPAQWTEDIQQLQHLRLFQNVAAASLQQLLKDFRACELEAGEILLSPFNRNHFLYMVLHGQLKVYLGSLDNQPVTTLAPGDCAGEISFIDNDHPSAYVVAAEPTTVLRLHRESLISLFQHSPQVMQNLLGVLCEKVRQGNRIILDTEQNANIDTLTGLFNRRWLEHIYDRESTRCAFNEHPLCLLMLDVDHFKDYNDEHGHLAGDYALCLVAHTLRSQLRPKDSMARYGGEEFVILLPEIGVEEARRIGNRLRQSLEQVKTFYSPMGVLPGVTVSLGLAQMDYQETLPNLILRADSALYQAKQEGRNRLVG